MPLHPAWKPVAKDLPDVRVAETNHGWSRREVQHRLMGWMEQCFCANCGKPHGMITKEWAAHVFALCDDCVGKHGPPPGVAEVPESLLKG